MPAKNILLVEDDFLNRRLAKKILIENGYFVFEAKNAKEAIAILTQEKLELAILDINLGENQEDGISLAQQIQEKYTIPFLYLTAYDNPAIINQAIATKPYSYLTKPFKNADLIASIEIALRQSADMPKNTPSIMVKDGDYNVKLAISEINYILSEGNYLLFYTDKKSYKCRNTIKQILEILPSNIFLQTHRAYVVNKNKIQKFSSKEIIIGQAIIPVSKNYMDNIEI